MTYDYPIDTDRGRGAGVLLEEEEGPAERVQRLIRRLVPDQPVETLPDMIRCERDGWEMEFISIELGYSCRNPNCKLHVKREA